MLEIVFNEINKSFGNKKILNKINFEIKSGEKIGLIGPNGSGKTTILKMITKEEIPTSGDIFIRKDATIGILSQYPDVKLNDYNVKEILNNSFEKINNLKLKLIEEEKNLSTYKDEKLEKSIIRYTKLQEEYMKSGGYEVESKIDKIVAAFQVKRLLDKKYKDLSGGEKTIINLIVLLLKNPDILLLDEPTNHLDIKTIEWLDEFLSNSKKTLIIVSHDRYFLDKVVNKIILIDNAEVEIFNGNYSYFITENENRVMKQFNDYKNQQKKIEEMKKSIKRLREYGKLAYPCGEKFFRRAASIEKRLEKMEILDKPKKTETINLNFKFDQRSGNDIVELNKFNYSIGDKELFKNANLFVRYKEKVCIMGPNGSGKSTLIKQIINNNNDIRLGSRIKIGYIEQDIVFDNENIDVITEARKHFIGSEDQLRSALVRFLFYAEGIYTKLNCLSGGERLRLRLFCLIQKDNNLLILDEPTNHIDINTKEVLEDVLNSYDGTLIFISHDRYFINKVATRIVMIEDKKLISYIGNYDNYLETKNKKNTSKHK